MDQLTRKILATYELRWDELPWEKQRHFAYRAWVVTRGNGWRKRLLATRAKTEHAWRAMEGATKRERIAYGLAARQGFRRKFDLETKMVFYEAHPEYVYWDGWFTHYRYLALTGEQPEQTLSDDTIDEVSRLVLSREGISRVAEWVTERVADMRWLLGIDLRQEMERIWKEVYVTLPEETLGLTRMGYALTHLVIGESRYYTQAVPLDYFANDLFEAWGKKLVGGASVDVVAEMLVCNQLLERKAVEEDAVARQRIQESFDRELGRLVRPERNALAEAEHRNIMAVMGLTQGWLENFRE